MSFGHEPIQEVDRLQQAYVLDAWVQSSGLAESLESAEKRHDFIMGLSGDDFVGLAEGINRQLLNLTPETDIYAREINGIPGDGQTGIIDAMPAPEDKIPLLKEVLAAAQSLEDPADQAVVIGYGMNIVHPYDAANGRTARALYGLLSRDYTPQNEQFIATLREDGDNVFMLDGNVFTDNIYQAMGFESGMYGADGLPNVLVRAKKVNFLTEDGKIATTRREFDETLSFGLMSVFMKEELGSLVARSLLLQGGHSAIFRRASAQSGPKTIFLVDEFMTHASDSEMAKAYDVFRNVKIGYTRMFLDLMTGHYDHKYRMINPDSMDDGVGLSYLEFSRKFANHEFANPDL